MTNDDRAHSAPINDDAAEGGREGEEKAGKGGGGECGGGTIGPQAPPTPAKSPRSVTPIEAEGPWGRKEKAEADSLAATALLIEKLDPKQLGPAVWPVVLDAWRRVQGYIQTVEECRKEDRTRIQTLETRVKEVEKGLSGRTLKGSSWAHIAGNQQQGVGPVPNATAAKGLRTAAPAKKLDNAKMRRITVQIRDEKEKEAAGKADKEDLVRSFRNAANEATKDIVAAFTKPAGEVVIITATVEAREALEKRREWATVGYPSAEVKRQTFPVVLHGVRWAAIDIEKQEATITKIVEANQVLHPDLQVERVWWPAGARRLGPQGREKTASSLVLELVTPEEVNEVVRKGLVGAGSLLSCERWERRPAVLQCFRCTSYGHYARSCPNPVRCGTCSGAHDTREHRPENGTMKCPVCAGEHPAWSPDCPKRRAEIERGSKRLGQKPKFYDTTGLRTASRKDIEKDAEGFTTVVSRPSKKRKAAVVEATETPRPRGRPTKLSQKESGRSTLMTGLRRTMSAGGRAEAIQVDSEASLSTQ